MIKRIAVLLTCYNRKENTINCLKSLFVAHASQKDDITLSVYLTDDASPDGTKAAVSAFDPGIHILDGTGDLFWAGGMRISWMAAVKNDYDAYLLLNDDTVVSENLFDELISCYAYSMSRFKQGGIYLGSTHDGNNNRTYGGALIKSRLLNRYIKLTPNGTIQECDLGNANIMLVAREVVKAIGILSDKYRHGGADYDYTFTARRKKIPVLVAANYCGVCLHNSTQKFTKFADLSFSERRNFLYHPKGLAMADYITYMKNFSPLRVPFIYAVVWLKLLFPKVFLVSGKQE